MFFFWVKNSCRALHCHRAVAAPFFFFSFFLFCQKKFCRSSHRQKENFGWNYPKHWCEFNVWQNVMVEASTMVIWCCESVIFFFFKIKIALIWTTRTGRSDRGSYESLLFLHEVVFDVKRIVILSGSRFFRSDRTVQSRFKNLGFHCSTYLIFWCSHNMYEYGVNWPLFLKCVMFGNFKILND